MAQGHNGEDLADCELRRFERNRFFHGKLMTARDMAAEQDYHQRRLNAVARHVLGEGIVSGLETEVHGTGDALDVSVRSGLAIDCCGRPVVVEGTAEATIENRAEYESGGETDGVSIYLEYDNCVKETVPIPDSQQGCEPECEYNRVLETVEIRHESGTPDGEPPVEHRPKPDRRVEFPEREAFEELDEEKRARPDDHTLQDAAASYYEHGGGEEAGELRAPETCEGGTVFLGHFTGPGEGEWSRETDGVPRPHVYTNDMLYAAISQHAADFDDPHDVTAEQAGAIASVEGVHNPGGNVDLESPDGTLTIDRNEDEDHQVDVELSQQTKAKHDEYDAHLDDAENPHDVTAGQAGALESVAGVANPGGDVDLFSSDDSVTVDDQPGQNRVDLTVEDDVPTDLLVRLDAHERYVGHETEKDVVEAFYDAVREFGDVEQGVRAADVVTVAKVPLRLGQLPLELPEGVQAVVEDAWGELPDERAELLEATVERLTELQEEFAPDAGDADGPGLDDWRDPIGRSGERLADLAEEERPAQLRWRAEFVRFVVTVLGPELVLADVLEDADGVVGAERYVATSEALLQAVEDLPGEPEADDLTAGLVLRLAALQRGLCGAARVLAVGEMEESGIELPNGDVVSRGLVNQPLRGDVAVAEAVEVPDLRGRTVRAAGEELTDSEVTAEYVNASGDSIAPSDFPERTVIEQSETGTNDAGAPHLRLTVDVKEPSIQDLTGSQIAAARKVLAQSRVSGRFLDRDGEEIAPTEFPEREVVEQSAVYRDADDEPTVDLTVEAREIPAPDLVGEMVAAAREILADSPASATFWTGEGRRVKPGAHPEREIVAQEVVGRTDEGAPVMELTVGRGRVSIGDLTGNRVAEVRESLADSNATVTYRTTGGETVPASDVSDHRVVAQSVEEAGDGTPTVQVEVTEPVGLDEITGIGPARRRQLRELGVTDGFDLLNEDVGALVEREGISESMVNDWRSQSAERLRGALDEERFQRFVETNLRNLDLQDLDLNLDGIDLDGTDLRF